MPEHEVAPAPVKQGLRPDDRARRPFRPESFLHLYRCAILRDALWFGLYTGMRREEVLTLRWEGVDMDALAFRIEETRTGVPLELPVTCQLAAILQRRLAAAADLPGHIHERVFPSPTSATGHVQDPHHLCARIGEAGGAKFWFHGLRNCFIAVAERELDARPRH